MKGRPSLEKRRKERARQDKKKDKAERRADRRLEKAQKEKKDGEEEDPDIAGIVPGPQRLPEEFHQP